MTGRDLIKAADLRSVIEQIDEYNTAIHTFRLKYNCLPGDCANATGFWPVSANCGTNNNTSRTQTCNGDGDNRIGFSTGAWQTNFAETSGVWNQLGLAKLIAGTYEMAGGAAAGAGHANPGESIPGSYNNSAVQIRMALGGIAGAVASLTANRHIFVVARSPQAAGWPSWTPLGGSGNVISRIFTSREAHYIDSKIDDGLPYSGIVSGTWDAASNSCGRSAAGVNVYTMTNYIVHGFPDPQPHGCALYFRAKF